MSRIHQPHRSCACFQPQTQLALDFSSSVARRYNFDSKIWWTIIVSVARFNTIPGHERYIRTQYGVGISFNLVAVFRIHVAKLIGFNVLSQDYREVRRYASVKTLWKRHREEFPFN